MEDQFEEMGVLRMRKIHDGDGPSYASFTGTTKSFNDCHGTKHIGLMGRRYPIVIELSEGKSQLEIFGTNLVVTVYKKNDPSPDSALFSNNNFNFDEKTEITSAALPYDSCLGSVTVNAHGGDVVLLRALDSTPQLFFQGIGMTSE